MNEVEKTFDDAIWRLHRLKLACEGQHASLFESSRRTNGQWQPYRCAQCEQFAWAVRVFEHWKEPQIGEDDMVAARNILLAGERRLGPVIQAPE